MHVIISYRLQFDIMGEGKTTINLRDYIKIRSNVTNVGRKGDDVNMRGGGGLTCFAGIK